MQFTIPRPDDWHVHLRDDARLPLAIRHSSAQMGRIVVMPNLIPAVDTIDQMIAYQALIHDHLPPNSGCTPLMTMALTPNLTKREVDRASTKAWFHGVKLYPANVTTNSEGGVTDPSVHREALQAMMYRGVPMMIHGEASGPDLDPFEREELFLQETLPQLRQEFPKLRIVLEHITTAAAVAAIEAGDQFLAATITPQHLLYDRRELFAGAKMRPHLFCLPILKHERDRDALRRLALSEHPRVFAGTDSAPHVTNTKEAAACCAGCYTANAAVELYLAAFEAAGANFSDTAVQQRFADFMSGNGARFYRRGVNEQLMTLQREPQTIPTSYELVDGNTITPLCAGTTLNWTARL